jgi:hypothetical protein
MALLCGNIIAGAGHVGSAWPLACYPTFSGVNRAAERESIEIAMLTPAGEEVGTIARQMSASLGSTRWAGLMAQVVSAPDESQRLRRMAAVSEILDQVAPSGHGSSIRFYRVTISTVPEQWPSNPLRRELLVELQVP